MTYVPSVNAFQMLMPFLHTLEPPHKRLIHASHLRTHRALEEEIYHVLFVSSKGVCRACFDDTDHLGQEQDAGDLAAPDHHVPAGWAPRLQLRTLRTRLGDTR